MVTNAVPAVLLAQGGGHGHLLTVGVSIGPTVLRIALLVAIPVVAGFALLRGFLAEPDRRSLARVVMAAGVVATLELLLSGGLNPGAAGTAAARAARRTPLPRALPRRAVPACRSPDSRRD